MIKHLHISAKTENHTKNRINTILMKILQAATRCESRLRTRMTTIQLFNETNI